MPPHHLVMDKTRFDFPLFFFIDSYVYMNLFIESTFENSYTHRLVHNQINAPTLTPVDASEI